MGKWQREKGISFERWAANRLRGLFEKSKRHLEYADREGDAERGIDVEAGPLRIQCKRNKKYCSVSKLEEVICSKKYIPALITKGDRKDPVICLYLDDFIKLMDNKDKVPNLIGQGRLDDSSCSGHL